MSLLHMLLVNLKQLDEMLSFQILQGHKIIDHFARALVQNMSAVH